jgi:hypothetical protein
MSATKTARFGRFLIRSKMAISHEEMRTLLHRNYGSIMLVWRKVMRGTWRIVDLG